MARVGGGASRHTEEEHMGEPQTSGETAALNALLGPGSVVEGKLSFEGQVGIDGTFTGEITTKDLLVIGHSAHVSADIRCGSVVVKGEVNGNIRARDSVELHESARVKAEIATPALLIDKGAVFDGGCRMEHTGDPLDGRSRSAAPARPRTDARRGHERRDAAEGPAEPEIR
jgi:cytoskeletal protein CcmA (bactofilin family)